MEYLGIPYGSRRMRAPHNGVTLNGAATNLATAPFWRLTADLQDCAVFGPEAITAMAEALEQACEMLRISGQINREIIAARIIDLARSGVVDASALRDRVLLEADARP